MKITPSPCMLTGVACPVLVEVRHDLIDTLESVDTWGERLTRCLNKALEERL